MAVPRYSPTSSRAEADEGRPKNEALQRRQGNFKAHAPQVSANVQHTRQMFYQAQRHGMRPNEAARLVNQVNKEVATMGGSSFAPGSDEYNQYFEERRKGTPRPEAFRNVLGFDPDKEPSARELQEGRRATELPGGRKSFHAEDADVEAMNRNSGDVAKRRQQATNRRNDEGGSGQRPVTSRRGSDDEDDNDADIPDNWKDMPAADVRSLAEGISGTKVSNREQAEEIIEEELAKRESE